MGATEKGDPTLTGPVSAELELAEDMSPWVSVSVFRSLGSPFATKPGESLYPFPRDRTRFGHVDLVELSQRMNTAVRPSLGTAYTSSWPSSLTT